MRYLDTIKRILKNIRKSLWGGDEELQPGDILSKLIYELENRKKLGIEENAFVPNVYAVYLSPVDYEELSPLLSGIRDQLKNKLIEKIKKKGYRLLSSSLGLEIREDSSLQKNQLVIESSFLKEKAAPVSIPDEKVNVSPIRPSLTRGETKGGEVRYPTVDKPAPEQKNTLTRIIEDKKTKIIDNTRLELEIMDGENRGEVIKLKEGEYTFGRGKDAAILLRDNDETVSRVHFKLIVREGRISIKDLNSANGTKLNEIDIEEAELKKGDIITAGKVLLKVA
jgi:hypothetical protein